MSPLEQDIENLKQRINEKETEISDLKTEINLYRDHLARGNGNEQMLISIFNAITAARTNLERWEHQLSELKQHLKTLEDNQMKDQLKLIKSTSSSASRSRSSSFSSTQRKQSGNLSDRSSPRAGSSGFLSTPGKFSGSESGSHTPYQRIFLQNEEHVTVKVQNSEILRYFEKLKITKKNKRISEYHVKYQSHVVTVSWKHNRITHFIKLKTATDVRNMYMLFALCEKKDILAHLIENNFDYK